MRNFGSSLGLAILGTILILENKSGLESTLGAHGVPKGPADRIAESLSQAGGVAGRLSPARGRQSGEILTAIQHDFARSSQTVFYVMAGVMTLAFLISLLAMPRGKVEEALD